MDEHIITETKVKSSGILRRILWWVWVILLAGLLLFCLIIEASWKVTALIAIFLTVATILPRIYRKWFWLGVGVVVLAIIVWVFSPDNNEGWRPYTFDKELAELQARYAVPDSENAAILYNQIFKNWKQKEANEPNLPIDKYDMARKSLWLSKDLPEIAAYIHYNRDIIEQLLQATKFDRCAFPIITDSLILSQQMWQSSAMRQWAYLLIAAGNNDMAEGYTDKAPEKYLSVIKMGQQTRNQPTVIEWLVGVAVESLGLGGINNFTVLGDANELYLEKAGQAVSAIKNDWSIDLTNFIDGEKLMHKNMLSGLFYEIDSKGNTRFSRDPYAKWRQNIKEYSDDVNITDVNAFSGYWYKKLFKAYTILYWFYMPQTPERMGEIVDASFNKLHIMADLNFDWSKKPKDIPIESLMHWNLNFQYFSALTIQMNKTSYFRLHFYFLRHAANQNGALLIIAMRHYKNANGHWPEKLEDIKNLIPSEIFIDPINGDSFVYKRTEENFTLYSKGKNGIDDGGEQGYDTEDKSVPDDFMIWPRKSKSSEQQKTTADANERRIK